MARKKKSEPDVQSKHPLESVLEAISGAASAKALFDDDTTAPVTETKTVGATGQEQAKSQEILEEESALETSDEALVAHSSSDLNSEEGLGEDELPPSSEVDESEAFEALSETDEIEWAADQGDSEDQPVLEASDEAESDVEEAPTVSVSEAENELANFESVEIEELEFVEYDRMMSIVESLLFASDRPLGMEAFKAVFKGTNVKGKDIKAALKDYAIKLASQDRGVSLEEIGGGYQLRTKVDNAEFMRRNMKGRAFKLSGPALEVLSIVAYKQPCIKSDVDQIRGVESGHLMRALMDRGLIRFGGKSELPGKPMFYETTRRFLEIFGLRNIQELPSLAQIDELIPDGIGEIEEEKKKVLADLTPELSVDSVDKNYSVGEEELLKISEQLSGINTSSDFFEQEKARQKRKRDEERAQDIREALMLGQDVEDKDVRWLKKFEQILEQERLAAQNPTPTATPEVPEQSSETIMLDAREEASEEGTIESEDGAGSASAEESVELTDQEILAKVDFEMEETAFKGEEVVGLPQVSVDDNDQVNDSAKEPREPDAVT